MSDGTGVLGRLASLSGQGTDCGPARRHSDVVEHQAKVQQVSIFTDDEDPNNNDNDNIMYHEDALTTRTTNGDRETGIEPNNESA